MNDTYCQDPFHHHDETNLWHRWRDEKGQKFASRCPLSHNLPPPEPKPQDSDLDPPEDSWWEKL